MLRIGSVRLGILIALATLGAVGLAYLVGGGRMFSPGGLQAKPRKVNHELGGVNSHADLATNCAACHAGPLSRQIQADLCLACHTDLGDQIVSQQSFHARIADVQACDRCHTEHQGPTAEITNFAMFDHRWTDFHLTGKHQSISCQACHKDHAYQGTAKSCVSCHAEPKAHFGKFGLECAQCHSTDSWTTVLLRPELFADFDHDLTAFKLTGGHREVSCTRCHVDQVFKGTAKSCVSCHAEPKVHLGKFGLQCAQCHSTDSWKSVELRPELFADFDHDLTAFKLTGGHREVSCTRCHVDQVFKGTAKTCVSCHAEPDTHLGKFGLKCAQCHGTESWKGIDLRPEFLTSFDHDLTDFKLTGEHRTVSCMKCHDDHVFKGTAKTCISCHAEPVVHRGVFGLDCAKCHTPVTWKSATIEHKFPLKHGGAAKKGTSSCVICHIAAPDYETYTCYGCHEHQPEKMARKHSKLTRIELQDCAHCHPTGKEDDHRGRNRDDD